MKRILWIAVGLLMAFTSQSVYGSDLSKGIELLDSGKAEEARVWFEARVSTEPGNPDAHYWLGRAFMAEGNPRDARAPFKRAAELDPENGDVFYWIGRSYVDELQTANVMKQSFLAPKVKSSWERAVELDPDHVDARISLGNYYLNAPRIGGGSKAKAKEQAREIMKRDPVRGRFFMAQVLEAEGDLEGAEKEYIAITESDPNNVEALFVLGRFYQNQERWPEAFDAFEKAVTADPDHRMAWYQLGRTGALSATNVDRSIEAMTTFIDRFADDEDLPEVYRAGAHWRLGMLWEHKHELDRARNAYHASLAIDPNDEDVQKALKRLKR